VNQDPERLQQAGLACLRSGDLGLAESLLQQVLLHRPDDVEALYGLAEIGFHTGRPDLVIAMMRRCIALDPEDGGSYHNLGNALRSKGDHDEAIVALKAAIRLMPNPADAHNTMGLTVKDLGRTTEAVAAFRRAISFNPAMVIAHSNLLLFSNYEPDIGPAELFVEHRRWSTAHEAPLRRGIGVHGNDRDPERPLRIGYVSGDLRQHSVAYFLLPLLEHRDRDQVHVTAYSNCAVTDEVSGRIQRSVDAWCFIAGASDEQVAEQIRADGIDILVDLSGHTADHRLLVFARKPAPVQIAWVGYPGTTGLDAMDYRCSDRWADPVDEPRPSSEQVLLLPHTTWCYVPLSGSPEVAALPALSNPVITFGSFNNFGKISSATLDMWAQILQQTPGSRLVLKNVAMRSPAAMARARRQFVDRGIAEDQVELLSPDESLLDHLTQYNRIDISLDTFPYHGTTTTCEALWMGVPSITLAGPNHASRPGVSLLSNVGLGDLIATTPDEYVETAVRLAGDLPRLAGIRAGLRQRMLDSPLMDGPSFARDMEACYRQVWQTWCEQGGSSPSPRPPASVRQPPGRPPTPSPSPPPTE
jgi:predicted O-linked N-acetylglucosamine transferase (SPINDLY family)